jgi:hypothetical protein
MSINATLEVLCVPPPQESAITNASPSRPMRLDAVLYRQFIRRIPPEQRAFLKTVGAAGCGGQRRKLVAWFECPFLL